MIFSPVYLSLLRRAAWSFWLCGVLTLANAQSQTVGVFLNDSLAFNGYTLFAPSVSKETYLIDNCGYVINSWTSQFYPGLAIYLLEDGSLLRTCRINSQFNSGGSGGRIEKYSWDGDLLWGHNYSTDLVHQHHDIAPMPNGNILILAWEVRTKEDAVEAGRAPATFSSNQIWLEHIVEWKIEDSNPPETVWEWYVWDHLIQDFDSTQNNYGVVAENPGLFDFNYINGGGVDWLHFNAIDYNEELDQIILSSRNWNEFFIIDHSTTSEEAASHQGGKAGKGGDILYRWGNPQTYKRGTPETQKLFGQHDVEWIDKGLPDEGDILVFNNGNGRTPLAFSSVEVIDPPLDAAGNYELETGQAYGPLGPSWFYAGDPLASFYAGRVSGADRLANGNTLICEGTAGRLFEVTPSGEIVWEYINPVRQNGAVSQGTPVTNGNEVFRVQRLAPDHPAFTDRDLVAGERIELNPLDDSCRLYQEPLTSVLLSQQKKLPNLYPNPLADLLYLTNHTGEAFRLKIMDARGRLVFEVSGNHSSLEIATGEWPAGIYFAQIIFPKNLKIQNQTLLKI